MFIKSLKLENIRSYSSQFIEFNQGTTLLSGDIGSGKSTILMALEFALFGILRGKISPAELLRHDSKTGSVTLSCSIQGKDVVITRILKRSGDNILQQSGSISINGEEQELVATELKASILNLMGYPDSLLSKSTNLFRYTVYTPQEQVKIILNESVEERKDIIRKIFSLDKYKRVSENASFYVSDSRERIERLKGQTDDLKTLEEQFASLERELSLITKKIPDLKASLKKETDARLAEEKRLDALEKDSKENEKKKKKLELLEKDLQSTVSMVDFLSNQIKKVDVKFEEKDVKFDSEKLKKIENNLTIITKNKSIMNKRFGAVSAKREQANKLDVEHLTTCPTCKQNVSEEHKEKISLDRKKQLDLIEKEEAELKSMQKDFEEKEKEMLEKKKEFLELEKKRALYIEKKKLHDNKLKELENNKKKIEELNKKKASLEKEVKEQKDIVANLPVIEINKDVLKALQEVERSAELKLNELVTKETVANQNKKSLGDAISKKREIVKRVDDLSAIRNWMQELFIPLVKTIEKRVLLSVYQDFNTHFTSWFGMLVNDDSIVVRLDEDFTPLVQQHGYDTNIVNLSGGERTSLALAYRLALNKVVNDYFGSLHTKGLLILDEPTDGFSAQQIDKLRDVLDQAGVAQLIIVSHEARLESIAQHLIRVEKDGTESRVS